MSAEGTLQALRTAVEGNRDSGGTNRKLMGLHYLLVSKLRPTQVVQPALATIQWPNSLRFTILPECSHIKYTKHKQTITNAPKFSNKRKQIKELQSSDQRSCSFSNPIPAVSMHLGLDNVMYPNRNRLMLCKIVRCGY